MGKGDGYKRQTGEQSPACSPRHAAMALATCFTADCTAQDTKRKQQNKKGERQNQSKTTRTANRMEGRSQEDGGKKPNLEAALVPAQNTAENIEK